MSGSISIIIIDCIKKLKVGFFTDSINKLILFISKSNKITSLNEDQSPSYMQIIKDLIRVVRKFDAPT